MADVRENNKVGATFPGPAILQSSRLKWGSIVFACGLFTAALADIAAHGVTNAGLGAVIFGVATALSATALLPGAMVLRLDGDGFETTRFYRTKRYRWKDVSDFAVWSFICSIVVFRVAGQRPDYMDRRNAALTGGRGGYLPDSYGLSADSLAQTMIAWQQTALEAVNRSGHSARRTER